MSHYKPYINIENSYIELNYYLENQIKKIYIISFEQFNKIVNFDKNFILKNENIEYPNYYYNYKYHSLINFLHNINTEDTSIIFKNNNKFDLREENIIINHFYHNKIIEKYSNAIYNQGHFNTIGKDAYIMKNPYWEVNIDNKTIYLMYCEKNTIIKLDKEALNKINNFEKEFNNNNKLTFYKHSNGYILCSLKNLFIHQIITGCYGNGKGTKNISIDHIDQDPLNNCYDNLRIATREEQQNNQNGIKKNTKRERKHNAKPLPDGITQDMMKKYVVYYKQCYNREKNLYREFFQIEKHPKLNKIWTTTKSEKITILNKLHNANAMIEKLENKTYDEIIEEENKNKISLPPYISLKSLRNRDHLIFDKKCEGGHRKNLKMILPINYNLEEQLTLFKEKINTKYQHQNIE